MKKTFPKDTLTKIFELKRFISRFDRLSKRTGIIHEYYDYVDKLIDKFIFMKEKEILSFLSSEMNKIKTELDSLEKDTSDNYNMLESKYTFLDFMTDYLDIDEEQAELRAKRIIRNVTLQDIELIREQCGFSEELLNRPDFRPSASSILIDDKNKIWGVMLCGSQSLVDAFNFKCVDHNDPWYYKKESCEILGVYFAPDYIPESNETIDLGDMLKSTTGYETLFWMRNSNKTCSDELMEEVLIYRDDVTEIDIWTKLY